MPDLFATQLRTVRVVTLVPSTSLVRSAGTVQVAASSSGGGSVATDAIWDAAGDLAVGTGADTAAKLAIGSTGQVLTVAAGTASWATPAAGGVTSVDGNTGAVTAAQLLTSIKTVDGAGSGLDADLLDGTSSAGFATSGHSHAASAVTFTPNGSIAATDVQAAIQEVRDEAAGSTDLTYTASTRVVASSTGTDATLTLADGTDAGLMTAANFTKLAGIETAATADQSAAEILAALLTVDGAGSGLDADLLDGQSSAAFAPLASPTFTGTVTVPTGAVLGTPASVNLSNATSLADAALAATGTAGTYGSASAVPVITTDAKGRITGVTTATPTTRPPAVAKILARQQLR